MQGMQHSNIRVNAVANGHYRPWISGPADAQDYGQVDIEDSEKDPAFGGQPTQTNA